MWKENYYKLIFPALSEKDNIIWKVSEADDTVKFIESLLKEQRENCLNYLLENTNEKMSWKEQCNLILNSPEPTGKEK